MIGLGLLAAWEAWWWSARRARRRAVYEIALREARSLGRPLLVIGAPDRGTTGGYGCGDVTLDMGPTQCPNPIRADISRGIPLPDNSVVVFVCCVLEYVRDVDAAIREIERVSGGHHHIVGVEPWTATAWLYPGTFHINAATKLRRRALFRGRDRRWHRYDRTQSALPVGQAEDWTRPLPGGGRAHFQVYQDGSAREHVDRFDPARGPGRAAAHLISETLPAALRQMVPRR